LHFDKDNILSTKLEKDIVKKDGRLPMASGIDQATPISSLHSEHKLMIGNVINKSSQIVDHNPLGPQMIKGSPKETEVLPTPGPQLHALYDTNFDYAAKNSHEEVRRKANAKTTFYQHEVEQKAYNPLKMAETNSLRNPSHNDKQQVKVPDVKTETVKAANDVKPKSLPKRCCIVSGNKQFPLMSNLIVHPHMDHYFVKERTVIRPRHYLVKLVLHHQYLNRFVLFYLYYNNCMYIAMYI